MKANDVKTAFIELRASGKSYRAIGRELHISKTTCVAWERELQGAIAELKREQLSELYSLYYMTKETRIKALGETLAKVNDALDRADLTSMPPDKLLDYKLKYITALKEEYVGSSDSYELTTNKPEGVIAALGSLLKRVQAGEITPEQAGRESSVMALFLKAQNVSVQSSEIDYAAESERIKQALGLVERSGGEPVDNIWKVN